MYTADEDRKIFLNANVALRVFSEQLHELIKSYTRTSTSLVKLNELLELHKNKFGYQMHPQTLGFATMREAILNVPHIEVKFSIQKICICFYGLIKYYTFVFSSRFMKEIMKLGLSVT